MVDATVVVSYSAVVVTATDYSPFGVGLYGRSWSGEYRYGFNGMEDDLGLGEATFYRIHRSVLATWLSIDPASADFPFLSPYSSMNLSPLSFIDPLGDAPESPNGQDSDAQAREDDRSKRIDPKDLKFKYKLKRILSPKYWGEKGYDRMINYLTTCGNSFHDLVRKEPRRSMIVTVKTTYNINEDNIVGSGSQPWLSNQPSTRTFQVNPDNPHYIIYDMDQVRDQITVFDQDGNMLGGTPLNPRGTGQINIPAGTTSITIQIIPGRQRPTRYRYDVFERDGSVTKKTKYKVWGILRIRTEKENLPYNRNGTYRSRKQEPTTLWNVRNKPRQKNSPE